MLNEIDTILFGFDGTLIEVSIDFAKMRRDILALQPEYGVTINDQLYVLEMIDDAKKNGLSTRQIALGGFSQGACLASEYVARNAAQYAGLFVFSGALIGPPGMTRNYTGQFDEMPVFIGGSDVDPWIQHDFMVDTAQIFKQMGANVDFRTYPGMAHTINSEEIEAVREIFKRAILTVDTQG